MLTKNVCVKSSDQSVVSHTDNSEKLTLFTHEPQGEDSIKNNKYSFSMNRNRLSVNMKVHKEIRKKCYALYWYSTGP